MNSFLKIGKALLFPPIPIRIILVPVAIVFLVYSMVFVGTESVVAIISYVIAAYTLTIWCVKIPDIIKFVKNFKNENKYLQIWRSDARLRVIISLYGSFAFNAVYAIFQLWLGFYHGTFWYLSLAAYYIFLAVMRFLLVNYTRTHSPGENMREELIKYRNCGIVFLFMNLALSLIVFFMVYWNRTFAHHQITSIAMAAYTFTAFTVAIINIIKYRKYNSPVYSASKSISLAAASVSMMTLTSTLLTAFGDGTMTETDNKVMLALVGAAVMVFVILMAIYMIVESTKKMKLLSGEENAHG